MQPSDGFTVIVNMLYFIRLLGGRSRRCFAASGDKMTVLSKTFFSALLGYPKWRLKATMAGTYTLDEVIADFISLERARGTIYIYLDPSHHYSMTYSNGVITWKNSDEINHLMKNIVDKTESSGEGLVINHNIYLKGGTVFA